MANIKSAKKRILVTKTRNERNKAIKSAVKTAMKKVEAAVAANDKEAANAALLAATSAIDKAATKGVYQEQRIPKSIPPDKGCQQHCIRIDDSKDRWFRHSSGLFCCHYKEAAGSLFFLPFSLPSYSCV